MHGKGELVIENRTYDCTFNNGQIEGVGTMLIKEDNGTSTYIGTFKNNV